MTTTHGNAKNERRLWWIGWRQWFGWKDWMCSKWRDKADIARETEGTTSKDELRGPVIGDWIEPATEQNWKPGEVDNQKRETEWGRQPKMTSDETNHAENGRTRLTITDNFGTYRRMCGFGGGECRSVFCTLREKLIKYQFNKYE